MKAIKEKLEDLLTEFDEFGFQPTIPVPNAEQMAIKWKEELCKTIEEMEKTQ